MTEHTPGPWRIVRSGNFSNIVEGPSGKLLDATDDGYRTVATVQACCADTPNRKAADANRDANMRLIAAAPDLLDALILARDMLTECERIITGETFNSLSINAAIAKALGQTEE